MTPMQLRALWRLEQGFELRLKDVVTQKGDVRVGKDDGELPQEKRAESSRGKRSFMQVSAVALSQCSVQSGRGARLALFERESMSCRNCVM